MKVFESVKELRAELDKAEQSGIGFVPTMGALHAGHRSLVERARRENATVVVGTKPIPDCSVRSSSARSSLTLVNTFISFLKRVAGQR